STAASFVFFLIAGLAALLPAAEAQEPAPVPAEPGVEGDAADADVDALIRVLEDDAARARLIERLRAASVEVEPAAAATATGVPAEETLAGRLAEYTRELAEGAAELFAALAGLVDHV